VKKPNRKKLEINRETLLNLNREALRVAVGAEPISVGPSFNTCTCRDSNCPRDCAV
jgi:hypothetical protein